MKELNQDYLNYLTLVNLIIILGVIFFFYRQWKEMLRREEERDRKIAGLEKNIVDNHSHVKVILNKINKQIKPPNIEKENFSEVVTEDKEDYELELASLVA